MTRKARINKKALTGLLGNSLLESQGEYNPLVMRLPPTGKS
jgi:hypothetical protein